MKPRHQRMEGFAGQHLVVVPKPVREEAGRHPLLRALLVTDAGYFPLARDHYVERAQGSPTHLIIACLRGRGWFRTPLGERAVRPGDLVWLQANEPHAYGADANDPWTIGWVHFSGTEAEAWRRHVGFSQEKASLVSHVTAEGITALKLEQIHLSLERGYSIPDLISTATLLRTALDLAAHAVRQGGATRSASERITAVIDHLRENLAQPHRLDELAATTGLSVPHFCTLFRRQTGFAPIDFLIRQRIQRACRLLDTTEKSVGAIAAEVGYEDAYYFTRCFRRIVGSPPRTYRRIPKG
jgi:AraC family transcriptional regulator, arabinose operon regulatory protein